MIKFFVSTNGSCSFFKGVPSRLTIDSTNEHLLKLLSFTNLEEKFDKSR